MSYDIKIETANYEIQVDRERAYGFFEHKELGDEKGGGLWFQREGGRLVLTDYDGVACLSKEVINGLRSVKIRVPRDFE